MMVRDLITHMVTIDISEVTKNHKIYHQYTRSNEKP